MQATLSLAQTAQPSISSDKILAAARDTNLRRIPDAAFFPAYGKRPICEAWKPYLARAGVHGAADQWARATGYCVAPIQGSKLAIIDIDDPAFKAELVAAIPEPTESYTVRRGDHCHLYIRLARPLPKASFKLLAPDGSERASLRGTGAYVIGAGSAHYDDGKPTGDTYRANDKPVITLTAEQTDILFRLFGVDETPAPACRDLVELPHLDNIITNQYVRIAVENEIAILAKTQAGRNDQLNKSAHALGKLVGAGVLAREEAGRVLEIAAQRNGYVKKDGIRAALATIKSGLDAGEKKPRDLSNVGKYRAASSITREKSAPPQPAPVDESDTFRTTSRVTLGALIRILCSRFPVRALELLTTEGKSQRTMYRRRMSVTFIHSIDPGGTESVTCDSKGGTESVTNVSPRQIRETRVHIVFPQADPVSALIPVKDLTPELFEHALTEDEIQQLVGRLALTFNQKTAIRARLDILSRVEAIEAEIGDLVFIPPKEPIANLPDLRRHVLRQICECYEETVEVKQPDGAITEVTTPAALSNAVQACLIGVTTGALPGIRARGGIVQTAPPPVVKTFAPGERVPPHAQRVRKHSDGSVSALIHPVARQHVVDLPEPQAKQDKPLRVLDPGSQHGNQTPGGERPPRKPRRPSRERYAAQLMRNILFLFHVEADDVEPLAVLAEKIREVLRGDIHPDRTTIPDVPADVLRNPDPGTAPPPVFGTLLIDQRERAAWRAAR